MFTQKSAWNILEQRNQSAANQIKCDALWIILNEGKLSDNIILRHEQTETPFREYHGFLLTALTANKTNWGCGRNQAYPTVRSRWWQKCRRFDSLVFNNTWRNQNESMPPGKGMGSCCLVTWRRRNNGCRRQRRKPLPSVPHTRVHVTLNCNFNALATNSLRAPLACSLCHLMCQCFEYLPMSPHHFNPPFRQEQHIRTRPAQSPHQPTG